MDYLCGAFNGIVPKLWDSCTKRMKYLKELEDNTVSLRSESVQLKDRSEDVRRRLAELMGQQMRVKNQSVVNGWVLRAETMEKEVDEILRKADQELRNKCLGSWCPKNCCSSYKIGKDVVKMTPRVTKLTKEGQFDVVADELPPPPVEQQLMDNLASLLSVMDKLKYLRDDVMTRVREAEEQPMKRTNKVNGWLRSVEDVEKGREELESRCNGISSPGSNYQLLDEVMKMLLQVTKLTEEGKFDVVAHPLPPATVDKQLMDNVVVGFESKFEDVWQSVQNNKFPVIVLVGMGGVGKTTLLKQLNNKFLEPTHDYDLIVWITVSKSANLGKIRGALRRKLNITDHAWEDKSDDQKNSLISNKLENKKFVILLDDVWETLQLSAVGIPRPKVGNMSKIVLTTRSQEVCNSMDADKDIPVGCLPPNEAFSLFYSMLGEDILRSRPEMRELITDVVSECAGLPLALTTIGRAMRGKTKPRQWKDAKRTLEKYPSVFMDKENGVFSRLLFSYESLPNPKVKKCFVYCSLYPEDHNILEEEVVKLWLAEGFIGEQYSIYDAVIQGRRIIEALKQACLLETGERSFRHSREEETVKMHDVIRDMALWIACEREEKRNKFHIDVANNQDEIIVAPKSMANAERLSLWGRGITTEFLAGMSFCPNLTTLIIQDTEVEELPGEIVSNGNVLKVLDLSGNRRMRLPMGKDFFPNLEYLNVEQTSVACEWLKLRFLCEWKKLRFLIVDDTVAFPEEIISSLHSMQMFEQIYVTDDVVHIGSDRISMESYMLHELEGLKHIMDIRLVLNSAKGVEILLDSPKLQRCTTSLVLKQVESLPDMLDLGTKTLTKHLERLNVDYCKMSKVKLGTPSLSNNLREVSFFWCDEIRNLSSLIYVPNLCILKVSWCKSMSELIGEDTGISNVGTSLFSFLPSLTLYKIPLLRSICPQDALPFPFLEHMDVRDCDSLIKLPLDYNTASTAPPGLVIKGSKGWWDGLEWDSQATKDAFTPKFTDHY